MQIVIPCNATPSENNRINLQIESIVDQVNRKFGSHDWTPIRYYCRRLTQAQLIAFYQSADVALFTPLTGGMNLVAREFCACRNDDRGVLILSESSGAAADLKFGALLVDPYDVEGVASILYRALCMSESEQEERMGALRNHIRTHDVFRWSNSFHAALSPADAFPRFRRMPQEGLRESAHERIRIKEG